MIIKIKFLSRIFSILPTKAVGTALIAFSVLFLAQTNWADEKIKETQINLLPEGVKEDAILVRISVVKMSNTLNSLLEDLGPISDEMELPVNNVNKRTLSAVINTLRAMQGLEKRGIKDRFHAMKLLVRNSFSSSSPATSSDFINFLLAANYLDIPDLLRPAAANVVDSMPAEKPEENAIIFKQYFGNFFGNILQELLAPKKLPNEEKLKAYLKEHRITQDLFPYLIDYFKFRADPTSLITKSEEIIVQKDPQALIVHENKIYVANAKSNNISVIDPNTGLELHKPIAVGEGPKAMIISDDKLYVANSESNNISVIDLKTDKVIGQPIVVGRRPCAMSVFSDKLFVANGTDNNISIIDLKTEQVLGEPLPASPWPSALTVFNNKLYVASLGLNNISVINLENNQAVGEPISVGLGPSALSVYGNKLLIANFAANDISVMDLMTDQVSAEPIIVGQSPAALSIFDHKLFAANFSSENVSVVDLKKNKTIGSPLAIGRNPSALIIFDKKLYVANKNNTVLVFDLKDFLYYSR